MLHQTEQAFLQQPDEITSKELNQQPRRLECPGKAAHQHRARPSQVSHRPFFSVKHVPRILYCYTNNNHVLSLERKGKIRIGQRTVQRASAIMEHKLGQIWRKRVQARTWCIGRETKDGDEQNATGIKPCNHADVPHDLTHKHGKTSSTIHDRYKKNLKRAVLPFKPYRKATTVKLEVSQATITSRTKYHKNNKRRRGRITWKLMLPLHEPEI